MMTTTYIDHMLVKSFATIQPLWEKILAKHDFWNSTPLVLRRSVIHCVWTTRKGFAVITQFLPPLEIHRTMSEWVIKIYAILLVSIKFMNLLFLCKAILFICRSHIQWIQSNRFEAECNEKWKTKGLRYLRMHSIWRACIVQITFRRGGFRAYSIWSYHIERGNLNTAIKERFNRCLASHIRPLQWDIQRTECPIHWQCCQRRDMVKYIF